MAKSSRGSRQGAQSGSRAKGESKGGSGRKPGRPQDARYELKGAARKQARDTPCIARGRHDKDCICGGTGWIKTIK